MSLPIPEPSDPEYFTQALLGTWKFPSREEPSGMGYLHFSEDGRAFNFVFNPEDPERRLPMRLWFTVESAWTLRFHPDADSPGWVSGYHLDDSALTLSNPTRTLLCLRPDPEEVPDWFHACLAAALARP